MTVRYLLVRDEITEELANLNKLFKKIVDARGLRESNEFYTEFAAMSLQSYYTSVERILSAIAARIDGAVPEGERWRHELLDQATIELPGIRPAVISKSLREELREFLGFRHVVRNISVSHQCRESGGTCRETLRDTWPVH